WADAWERAGRRYYPKALSAVPFSPVQGPRLLAQDAQVAGCLLADLDLELYEGQVSGLHLLLNDGREDAWLAERGWLLRLGGRFHCFHRGYGCLGELLAACNSRKRKIFRRGRERIVYAGIEFQWPAGHEL